MKLRPMKTAPRDGTPILLYAGRGQFPFMGYWGNPFRFRKPPCAWIGHEWGLQEDHDLIGWLPLRRAP